MTQQNAVARLHAGEVAPDATVYAGTSPDGRAIYTLSMDVPLKMTFDEAQRYCTGLNKMKVSGRDDWHVPTAPELNVLFNNYAAIGGFSEVGESSYSYYWSSTPWKDETTGRVWAKRFSDGDEAEAYVKKDYGTLRPVCGKASRL